MTHLLSPPSLRRHALVASACLTLLASTASQASGPKASIPRSVATAQTEREAELMRRLDRLASEVDNLKMQLAELKAQPAGAVAAMGAPTPPVTTPAPVLSMDVANGVAAGELNSHTEPATVFTGYGELNYNRYRRDASQNQADMRRFVLGYQHRFDAKTKVVAELEVEHAVTSASGDPGEVAIEQAYAERQLNSQWALRTGLFLMPAGLLNENHEPTAYYGVERNAVETAIIPSTWREGGVQFVGNLDKGWTVQGGVSTSFDLSKWANDDAETAESPLGASHQELAQAHAKDLALFGAVNWRGLPGLQLGVSLFSGNAGQGQAGVNGNRLRVNLWDMHARYTPGDWDLSALYARGTISGTAAFNALSLSSGPDWYPVPRVFDGAYVQAAYKIWRSDDLTLAPFARIERVNTRKAFADLGQSLTQNVAPTERIVTAGANLNVGQGLVFKADVQRFHQDKARDRLDLGVGWSF